MNRSNAVNLSRLLIRKCDVQWHHVAFCVHFYIFFSILILVAPHESRVVVVAKKYNIYIHYTVQDLTEVTYELRRFRPTTGWVTITVYIIYTRHTTIIIIIIILNYIFDYILYLFTHIVWLWHTFRTARDRLADIRRARSTRGRRVQI